jgi:hypothetical protein
VGARSPGSDGVCFPRRLSGSHAVVIPEIVIPSEARNLLFLASWDIRNSLRKMLRMKSGGEPPLLSL